MKTDLFIVLPHPFYTMKWQEFCQGSNLLWAVHFVSHSHIQIFYCYHYYTCTTCVYTFHKTGHAAKVIIMFKASFALEITSPWGSIKFYLTLDKDTLAVVQNDGITLAVMACLLQPKPTSISNTQLLRSAYVKTRSPFFSLWGGKPYSILDSETKHTKAPFDGDYCSNNVISRKRIGTCSGLRACFWQVWDSYVSEKLTPI